MIRETVKFLLVDDTEENLVALEALLRREGLELLKARSGSRALEMLLVHDVALAILDVQMPDMDGFELAELMRGMERTKHVPIIFLTAGAQDPQRVFKGYEAGAVDFLFKPIEPRVLKSKADVFFQLHQQKIELAGNLRMNEMFVGILGHDLRNPLNAIMTSAQLLERRLADEAQLRPLRRMVSLGGADEGRDRAAPRSHPRPPGRWAGIRARPAPPRRRRAGQSRRRRAARDGAGPAGLRCRARGTATPPATPPASLQLFSNLLSNALHHGTAGTPVSVTIEGTGEEIVVVVQNEGVIPPELLPQIFDPFRGARALSGSQGLGLGLFISQQIVAAHGGAIERGVDQRVRHRVPGATPQARRRHARAGGDRQARPGGRGRRQHPRLVARGARGRRV